MNLVTLLRDLVRIPSVNPMGQSPLSTELLFEHRLTAYLETFLQSLDLPCKRQAIAPDRENLIARFDSPGATTTILFEVHQDTVPVEGMTIDPFAGEVRDGRLYGRGACDVKGSMAAMLAVLARLMRERPSRSANVIFACTVDEEHTFLGVQSLVKDDLWADFAVVAEPTSLDIVDAHKGLVRWKLRTQGRACHSSRPDQGVNAIYRMGRIMVGIEDYARQLATRPPDPRLGPPTISVGRITGGVSVNTVPDRCEIEIDRRLIPGESPDSAPDELAAFLRQHSLIDFDFQMDPIWMMCPALSAANSSKVCTELGKAIDSVRGSHSVRAVPFGTDASSISEAEIPAVVFGPGDIAQAHTADEWIEIAQVEQAAEILYRLVTNDFSFRGLK